MESDRYGLEPQPDVVGGPPPFGVAQRRPHRPGDLLDEPGRSGSGSAEVYACAIVSSQPAIPVGKGVGRGQRSMRRTSKSPRSRRASFWLLRSVPYRGLRVMADQETGSEYLDWIARQGLEREVYRAFTRALLELENEWGCIWIPRMAGRIGGHERFRDTTSELGLRCHTRTTPFSAFPLPDDMESYLSGLSAKARYQTRKERRGGRRSPVTATTCFSGIAASRTICCSRGRCGRPAASCVRSRSPRSADERCSDEASDAD